MRADNHQILQPLFVSTLSDKVKFDVENSGLGFETDVKINAQGHRDADDLQDAAALTSAPPPDAEASGAAVLELVTFSLLNGVVYGLLLFMLSSGLTLIFSMMGVLNFAHASIFMLGAYFSYQIAQLRSASGRALVVAPAGAACSARWSSATACAACTATATSRRFCSPSASRTSSSSSSS